MSLPTVHARLLPDVKFTGAVIGRSGCSFILTKGSHGKGRSNPTDFDSSVGSITPKPRHAGFGPPIIPTITCRLDRLRGMMPAHHDLPSVC